METIEIKKLKALLDHWIEHCEEHQLEYAQWAEKINPAQYGMLHRYISAASSAMEKVGQSLKDALDELNKSDI